MYYFTLGINGGYGDWGEWTKCDQECGEGMQFRERACNNPVPSGGGDDCEALGDAAESRKCMLKECPGKIFLKIDTLFKNEKTSWPSK